jgi:hypothetical protein
MKRAILVVSLLAGCASPADQFRAAAPSQEAVTLAMPSGGDSSSSSVGQAEAQVIGQRAVFFEVTRGVTTIINGGVIVTLVLLHAITEHEPTSLTATHATWGPHTPLLSVTTWKFDVEKVGSSDYTYVLSAKPVLAADTAYKAIISGKAHVVSLTVGSGDFMYDFTALRSIDPGARAQGEIAVHYDNTSDPRVVEVAFQNFDDGIGSYTPNDALYRYNQHADRSGNFEFVTKYDVDHDFLRDQEVVSIRSEWLSTGQGRSDVKAAGGSLSSDATITECWNGLFQRTYFTDSWNPLDTEGDPNSCKP